MSRYEPTLPGMVYGFLTVVEQRPTRYGRHKMWLCQCRCGTKKTISQAALRSGSQVSCGCKKVKHGEAGKAKSPEYRSWRSMINRCYLKSGKDYKNWGGRGIRVCDRWRKSYKSFLEDVGRRPSPRHSLNRINNEGNYEPGNVVWSTSKEQARNTRKNVNLSFRGQTKPMSAWAEEVGLTKTALWHRLQNGWSVEKALTTPPRNQKGSGSYAVLYHSNL